MTAMTSNGLQQQQQHNEQANDNDSSLSIARKQSRNRKVFNPGALLDLDEEDRSRGSKQSSSTPNKEPYVFVSRIFSKMLSNRNDCRWSHHA